MKKLALAAAVAMMSAACGSDNPMEPSNTPITFTAQLRASNEVPAVSGAEASAQGSVTITFDVPRDSAGNTDPTPASRTWTVDTGGGGDPGDTTPPQTTITGGPSGTVSVPTMFGWRSQMNS